MCFFRLVRIQIKFGSIGLWEAGGTKRTRGVAARARRPGHHEGMNPMGIVFFCQSCGARFEVDPRMAGMKGHCKKCGQYMAIPRAQEIASMAAMPALASGSARGGCRPSTRGGLASPDDQSSGPGADHD